MKRRALNLLIALDQLLWVLLTLGHASPDETLSAGAWRMEQAGKWAGKVLRPLIDGFFLAITFGRDRDHCRNSYASERRRLHLPAAYRD